MSKNPLVILQQLGQSPWHDAISRDQLRSGGLKRLVQNGDITGLTSNPTIFQKAMSESDAYDEDLKRLAREGRSAEEIFYSLAIDDIRDAADLFAGVHERTGGKDGFVSIEVSPRKAYDTKGTIEEAHRLWKRIDRPNLMVKIPATKQGLPAIEQCIADGININVTLIFSLERYDEVMNAYLTGLIRRTQNGKPVDRIHSVASFFVSRVDTLVDPLLDECIERKGGDRALLDDLKGRAAIANAKLAYEAFRQKFATETFAALHHHGANLQRPLWASTSTKNPALPDTYYVDALVGPDSVDTMPPATIEAYREQGEPEVRIDSGLPEARAVLARLAEVGIDMARVTRKLEDDGVKAFADSFEGLLKTVDEQRETLVGTKTSPAARKTKTTRSRTAKKTTKKAARPRKASARRAPARKTPAKKATRRKTAGTAARRKTTGTKRKGTTAPKKRPATRRKTAGKKAATRTRTRPTRTTRRKKPAAKKTAARKTTAKRKSPVKKASRPKTSTPRTRPKKKTAARKPVKRKTPARRTRRTAAGKTTRRKASTGSRARRTSKRKR